MASRQAQYGHPADPNVDGRPVVLVIHPSPTVRHALLVTLDLEGFDVVLTTECGEAAAVLAHTRPQAVIADLVAAECEQGDLLRSLQSGAGAADIPLIVFDQHPASSQPEDLGRNGVRYVHREAGVGRLLAVLHEMTGQAPPAEAGTRASRTNATRGGAELLREKPRTSRQTTLTDHDQADRATLLLVATLIDDIIDALELWQASGDADNQWVSEFWSRRVAPRLGLELSSEVRTAPDTARQHWALLLLQEAIIEQLA